MRILWRRPEPVLILRKWLTVIAKNVQFAIIIPFALCAILCYPLVLELRDSPRPRIWSQQEIPPINSTTAQMRQAIFVPPVFVDALDPQMTKVVEPLKKLHQDIEGSEGPWRLYSMYNETISPESQFLTPESPNVQGLLFTFLYGDDQESTLWDATLESISNGQVPRKVPSHYINREELVQAEAASLKNSPYSAWPEACTFSRTVVASLSLILSIYLVTWLHTTTAYRPWVFMGSMIVRVLLGVLSSMSLVCLFYPDFEIRLFYRFLCIIITAVFIGLYQSIRLVDTIESSLNITQTALNRLICGYQQSLLTVLEIMAVQSLLGTLAWLYRNSAAQPVLSPLTAFMVLFIAVDTMLHYTFFAAITYINMLSRETYELACAQPYRRRKSTLFKFYNNALVQHKLGRFFGYGLYLPLLFYSCLYFNGGHFLFKVHPNIKNMLSKPVYIDSFINPLDPSLDGYSHLKIFKPIVFHVNPEFSPPVGKIIASTGHLKYGNSFSLILEMLCMKVFFSSLCMILLLLLTDSKVLSFGGKGNTADQAEFDEGTIAVESNFDLVKVSSDGFWISILGLDGTFKVVDFTSMSVTRRRVHSLPMVKTPWAVEQLLINATEGVAGTLHRSKVKLWNIASGRQYYELDYSQVLKAPPLATTFVKSTLLFITDAGRLIEAHTFRAPQVYVLTRKSLRWAFFHRVGIDVKAILCDNDNSLYFCRRSEGDQIEWSVKPLELSTAFIAGQNMSSDVLSVPSSSQWSKGYQECEDIISALCAPDINLWIAFTNGKVIFIDLLSGVVLQTAEFGSFKPGTARVLHTQPTHCEFCGATAISSLTIAYESLVNEGELVCQTWKMTNDDHKVICLRTEIDTHDGLFSAEVTDVRIDNVRTWATTKINMVMGLRAPCGLDDLTQGWEAFAVSATTGTTSKFLLDEDALDTQLLTSSPGQAVPMGPKSICIPFGNTLKILYLKR